MHSAEHQRKDFSEQMVALTQFKSGLGCFCRVYIYLSQLVDFGGTERENFALFAKLLLQGLKGASRHNVGLTGIILVGFDIKLRATAGDEEPKKLVLQPITMDSEEPNPEEVDYLQERIERLNRVFAEATPLKDQISFVSHIPAITKKKRHCDGQNRKQYP